MTLLTAKNQVTFYTIGEKEHNQRLDNLLLRLLNPVPKSHIYQIIRVGQVRVNKKRSEANYKLQIGDLIRIPPIKMVGMPSHALQNISSFTQANRITPPKLPMHNFPIVYEDEYFIIINKPSQVACHGGSGISFGVIEQLRQNLPQHGFLELAHRLDRDTSGLLILAKKRQALVMLQEQIKTGQVKKYYIALVAGVMPEKFTTVKIPLTKYLTQQGERRVKVDEQFGKATHTIFKVLKTYASRYTLVEANLKTGHTHQIRVHLQHLGHPIVGDVKYGDFTLNKQLVKSGLNRLFLHAERLEFIHPITKLAVQLSAPLPNNLQIFLNQLEFL